MKLVPKLTLFFIPLALMVVGTVLYFSRAQVHKVMIGEVEKRSLTLAQDTARSLGGNIESRNESAILPPLQQLKEQTGGTYAMALDQTGKVLAHTNVVEKDKTYTDVVTLHGLRSEGPQSHEMTVDKKPILDISMPILRGGEEREDFLLAAGKESSAERVGTLRLGLPIHETLRLRDKIFIQQAKLLTVAILIVAMGLVLFLLRSVLWPARRLLRGISRVSNGRYGEEIPVLSSDEIGSLTESFNQMSRVLANTTISKNYLDDILRHMLDPLFVLRPDGTFGTINSATTRLLGYSESELIGQPADVIFSEKEHPFSNPGLQKTPLTGEIHGREVPLKTKNGKTITSLFSSSVLRNKEDQIEGIICSVRDITELKVAEEELRKSETLNRSLIEHIPQRIFLKDRNSGYISCNTSYARDLGIKPEEIAGKDDFAFHPRELAEGYRADDHAVMESGNLKDIEEHYQAAGKEMWIHTIKVPFHDKENNVIGVLGIFQDITERKKLEAMLHQSEKLSAVGQLAAGVAHEINNPLGIILGFAQSIKSQASSDPSLSTALEFIEKEALRCKDLVQNLLVFSRSSRQDQQEEVDIKNAVEESLSLILAQSRVKDVELIKDLKEDLPPLVANKNQIQQIIINLCNNAMDAMPEKGTLTVRTDRLQKNGSDWIVVEVSDTGAGIPEEIQSRIFEPFFTTKEVGKGTGLGLSLVFEIVQRHKGTIDVKSEVGKGTTFTIYLPVQPRETPTAV
ncbi:MAG: PAS domain S-box protein [Elusimicrobia bacterium]|nr:PAS domain S-box protein [Candidatus Obscuribacterium magneticum]